jgi:hypothetical protein
MEAELEPTNGSTLDMLGQSVALHGDRLFASLAGHAVWDYFSGAGAIFERASGVWSERLRLLPSFGNQFDFLGDSVAFNGTTAALAGGNTTRCVFLFHDAALVGTPLCAGNGSGTACPCANESDPTHQFGCNNGYNFGAFLAASGTSSVSADDLRLSALFVINSAPVLLACGTTTRAGGSGIPYGDGLLCIGGSLKRLGVQTANPIGGGNAVFGPGLSALGNWSAGDTRYFQAYYRDSLSPCSTSFNLTNALQVVFTP